MAVDMAVSMTTGMLTMPMFMLMFMRQAKRMCAFMFFRRHHLTASVTVSPLMFHSFWWPSSSP